MKEPHGSPRLFQHDRVASGYASARPYLHPEALARARELIRPAVPFRRALDVGCGTGLSSLALLDLAGEVVGIDSSRDMLRHARRARGIRYVASGAEDLPFAARSFDLVLACGSMDWVDRGRFLPRVAELLGPGGWLVSLDFGDTGRSDEMPGLARWYDEVFQGAYARPAADDPMIGGAEAERHGFAAPLEADFAASWPFTSAEYAAFLMTESNVIAAVEYGERGEGDVRDWLERQLQPVFGGERHRVAFGGYVQALRKA